METISLSELKRRVKAFSAIEETKDIIAENEAEIVSALKEQLYAGYDGYDFKIGDYAPYHDEHYAEYKFEINSLPGKYNPDLRNTGAFYSGIEAKVVGGNLVTDSTDSKAGKLEEQYGKGIYKLGTEAKNKIKREIIQPLLLHRFADKTGATLG